jgi:hypothetical protein
MINKLPNGKYVTDHGSTLEISGEHSGISKISFDWLEEGGCVDCQCEAYPEEFDSDDWRLIWHCDYCDGGSAKLKLIN